VLLSFSRATLWLIAMPSNGMLSKWFCHAFLLWLQCKPLGHCFAQKVWWDCRDASDQDLQFAADLAAWHSKGKGEGKCPVIMASPTDIKKPKGAPPGKVLVSKEKTIMGRPDHSIARQQEQQGHS